VSSTASATRSIRVMVVDDHELVRSGLEAILDVIDDVELVAQAESGEEAVELCEKLHPDVVLMDLVMPRMDGATATRQIVATCPGTKVLALTSFSDPAMIEEVLRAGAIGCLLKNVTCDELATAIRRAHEGSATLAPEAAGVLIHAVVTPPEPPIVLTPREREVMNLLVQGLTNTEIAARLVVSLSTVKTHVSSIIAKLGASTRTEAAAIAVRDHLL
jgi:two-component system, NarL family, response regulator LiaR